MATEGDREAFALRVIAEVGERAREARMLRLDTLGYLLDMVALEARQYVGANDQSDPASEHSTSETPPSGWRRT